MNDIQNYYATLLDLDDVLSMIDTIKELSRKLGMESSDNEDCPIYYLNQSKEYITEVREYCINQIQKFIDSLSENKNF